MPADKQSALEALSELFAGNVRSAGGTFYASRAGGAQTEQAMRDAARTALRLAKEVDAEMRALIDEVFGEPGGT
jgi:hypothetical protein